MLTVDNASMCADRVMRTRSSSTDTCTGRGIVICAGGVKYNTCAWVLIRMLRHLGCELPIEVWYLGEDERSRDWIELVRPWKVECIDAFEMRERHPHPHLGGWEANPYAILHSRFEEVLFLDADNIPTVDPTFLFDTSEYQDTGAIFWPDILRTPPDSPRWDVFGVRYRDEWEQESGQLVIHKRRCRLPLRLCNWYNENSDFFYNIVHGDKDTFRFAWHRLGRPFSMPARPAEVLRGITLCQHDFSGRRVFQHRIHDKFSLLGNVRIPGFLHEIQCLQFVEELRSKWNPWRHNAPVSTDFDRRRMHASHGWRTCRMVGRSHWPIELHASGLIGKGRIWGTFAWWIQDGQLVLADVEGNPVLKMTDGSGDSWETKEPRDYCLPDLRDCLGWIS